MITRMLMITLLATCLLLGCALPAMADGALVPPHGANINLPGGKFIEPDQRCLIVDYGDNTQALILQVSFGKADLKEFGWLVPLPSVPIDIKPESQGLFNALYSQTVRYANYGGGGGGCGGSSNGMTVPPLQDEASGGRVDILDMEVVGDFDVFTVTADEPDDLKIWIEDNGYEVPEGYESIFQNYINKGWIFVAIKVHLPDEIPWYDGHYGQDMYPIEYGVLHPLAFKFATDELVYPMLISKLNGGGTVLTMYVLSDHRMQFKQSNQNWAEWLTEEELSDYSPLAYYVGEKKFLTKLRRTYFWDDDYYADLYLSQAPNDKEDRNGQAEMPMNFLLLGFLAVGFPLAGRIRFRRFKSRD